MHKIIVEMRTQLSLYEKQYGPLKYLLSRVIEKTSSCSIDKIVKIVSKILKNLIKMYDIKIFIEDGNFEARDVILYATCYNCFLLNTNFSSQYLLKKDVIFGHYVGIWPTLSPYLFLQIIWGAKCEDLLIESLVHIPLDVCVEILEITIKHIDELKVPQTRRFIFLLIYKVYYKCLWLHLGILSEQNVIKRIYQLVTYFEILCDLLVNPKFVASHKLSIDNKHFQHGILVKNIFRYIKKCMHSKIESYSENHNLAKLFTLTYGDSNEYMHCHHMLPPKEVKSIIIRFDQQLVNLLLNQIKCIDYFEFMFWENVDDDENPMISLQRAIVTECHYFIKFIRQNKFLVTNEHLLHCLERFVDQRKSNESTLTLPELCQNIAKGRLQDMKELIKRYKEWDLSILDFINKLVKLLDIDNLYIILKYLHHTFTRVHTKAEKYQVYTSVLKILIQLNVYKMYSIILKYIKEHFDDNYLQCLYDERSFDAFTRRNSFIEDFSNSMLTTTVEKSYRALLIFILLNPKEVLSKLVVYEMSMEIPRRILFRPTMFGFFMKQYYNVRKGEFNILMYILKNIIFQQRVTLYRQFMEFMNNMLLHQMLTADDIINQLYIPYLINSRFDEISLFSILSHMESFLENKLCTHKTDVVKLIIVLMKTASILKRYNTTFTKFTLCGWIQLIKTLLSHVDINGLTKEQYDMIRLKLCYSVEPFDPANIILPLNTLEIIQKYEKHCFAIHQRLRTNPRCHPKLRSYVQSFNLDREAFIRYIMLHSFETEYMLMTNNLTFVFRYHFGWLNEMMAYENIMRITVDTSEIILTHLDKFPKHTFVTLLFASLQFSHIILKNSILDKTDTIAQVLLRTLSSMSHMANRTRYADEYIDLIEFIKDVDPHLWERSFFTQVYIQWINLYDNYEPVPIPILKQNCICDESLTCEFSNLLIDKKVARMYRTYLFIRECLKLSNIHNYQSISQKRLLRSLCLTE